MMVPGERWRHGRQLSPVEGELSAVLSPGVARREVATGCMLS
ncbi:hypothetical protein A2U01_0116372, partial [Trifolium medium]|nr:hypothetical protein [Trifolium medium]